MTHDVGLVRPVHDARPRRRALTSRLSTAHVVMVLAGLLGVVLTLNVLRAADHTRPVLVAAKDLAPGTVISADAVRVARIHADDGVLAALVAGSDLGSLDGRIVSTTVRRGSLLERAALQPAGDGASTRVMSFPLARARAVGGKLATGDRVDVLAVEHDTGRSGYVADDVPVVAVDSRSGGPLGTDGDLTVSVGVDAQTAARLASALDVASVTLVRSTGSSPLQLDAPFTPSGTSRASDASSSTSPSS